MERSPFLPLPEGMIIDQIQTTETQLTVEVISTQSVGAKLMSYQAQMMATV